MDYGKQLLAGVSRFWTKFFIDTDILETLHRGTLEMVGGEYKKLLLSLMNMSLKDAPLTEEVPWTPIFIVETAMFNSEAPHSDGSRYLVLAPEGVRGANLVHNNPLTPTACLESEVDFEFISYDSPEMEEVIAVSPHAPHPSGGGWFLAFRKDPFNWDDSGGTPPGFAVRKYEDSMPLVLKDRDSTFSFLLGEGKVVNQVFVNTANSSTGETSGPVSVGDTVYIQYASGRSSFHTVSKVTASSLEMSVSTPMAPDDAIVGYSVGRTAPSFNDVVGVVDARLGYVEEVVKSYRVISGWIPNADTDLYTIYNAFGFAFTAGDEPHPSTEQYRSLIQCYWNLYVNGPSPKNMESSLNIVSGFPVVSGDGEQILSVDRRDPFKVSITTDVREYIFPANTKVRADVLAAAPSVDGVTKEDLVTLFTDATYLREFRSFSEAGISAGDMLRVKSLVDAGQAWNSIPIETVTDTYLKIPNDWALPDNVHAQHSSGLVWTIEQWAEGQASRHPSFDKDSNPGLFDKEDNAFDNYYLGGGSVGTGQFLKNTQVPVALNYLDTLTEEFVCADNTEDPGWWKSITLPSTLLDVSTPRRRVNEALYPNEIANPWTVAVGDMGGYIGRSGDNVLDPSRRPEYVLNPKAVYLGRLARNVKFTDMVSDLYGHKVCWITGYNPAGNTFEEIFPVKEYPIETLGYKHLRITPPEDTADDRVDLIALNSEEYDTGSLPFLENNLVNWTRYFFIKDRLGNVLDIDGNSLGQHGISLIDESVWPKYLFTATITSNPGKRRSLAYQVMDRFLKNHMFSVSFDARNNVYERAKEFYISLVLSAKPAGTYPYLEPSQDMYDNFKVPEETRAIDLQHWVGMEESDVGWQNRKRPPSQVTGVDNMAVLGARGTRYFTDTNTTIRFVPSDTSKVPSILRLIGFHNGNDLNLRLTPNWGESTSNKPWVSTYEVSAGVFSNRIRFAAGATQADLVTTSGIVAYKILDQNGDDIVPLRATGFIYGSSIGQGSVALGSSILIGGMDPLLDRHELEDLDNPVHRGASAPDYSAGNNTTVPPGVDPAVAASTISSTFNVDTQALIVNTDTIPGNVMPSGRPSIPDKTVTPDLDPSLMYVSDSVASCVVKDVSDPNNPVVVGDYPANYPNTWP